MRVLQYILRKLGYVKLSEVDMVLAHDGTARPASQMLPPYSFMFRADQVFNPPCSCGLGSGEHALPSRVRAESQLEPALGPFPYNMVHATAAVPSYGLDYSDGDTQIMEAPSVQPMPSFMDLKRRA